MEDPQLLTKESQYVVFIGKRYLKRPKLDRGAALREITSLLSFLLRHCSPATIVDTLAGLPYLASDYKISHPVTKEIDEENSVAEAAYYMLHAGAVYGWKFYQQTQLKAATGKLEWLKNTLMAWNEPTRHNMSILNSHIGIPDKDVIDVCWESAGVLLPGYYSVIDRKANVALIAIRGTMSGADALTDLVASCVPFLDGYAHHGIAQCAKAMERLFRPKLRQALKENPEITKVVITGHSLGGTTGTLLAMLLEDEFDVVCYSYGPAPCVSARLARRSAHFVKSFVLGEDLVCRLSMLSLYKLAGKSRARAKKERDEAFESAKEGIRSFATSAWEALRAPFQSSFWKSSTRRNSIARDPEGRLITQKTEVQTRPIQMKEYGGKEALETLIISSTSIGRDGEEGNEEDNPAVVTRIVSDSTCKPTDLELKRDHEMVIQQIRTPTGIFVLNEKLSSEMDADSKADPEDLVGRLERAKSREDVLLEKRKTPSPPLITLTSPSRSLPSLGPSVSTATDSSLLSVSRESDKLSPLSEATTAEKQKDLLGELDNMSDISSNSPSDAYEEDDLSSPAPHARSPIGGMLHLRDGLEDPPYGEEDLASSDNEEISDGRALAALARADGHAAAAIESRSLQPLYVAGTIYRIYTPTEGAPTGAPAPQPPAPQGVDDNLTKPKPKFTMHVISRKSLRNISLTAAALTDHQPLRYQQALEEMRAFYVNTNHPLFTNAAPVPVEIQEHGV